MADDTGSGDYSYGAVQEAPAPRTFYRGYDGHIHALPLPLAERLRWLRRRSYTLYVQAAVLCDVFLGLLLFIALLYLHFFAAEAPSALGLLALTLAAALIAVPLLLHRTMRLTWVRFNCQLYEKQLALMVADDQFWQQIFEQERNSPWLKWAQSVPPRSVEEHLVFAASYVEALVWLVGHPGGLRKAQVWRGNFSWHAGRPWCYACGLFSCAIPLLNILASPGYLFCAANLMARKAGRIAALCDFFMPAGAGPNPA